MDSETETARAESEKHEEQPPSEKFQDLEAARIRRDTIIKHGKQAAIGIGIAVIIIGSAFFFIVSQTTPTNKTSAPANIGLKTTDRVNCDNFTITTDTAEHPCALRAEFQKKYRTLTTQLMPTLEASASEEFVKTALSDIQTTETIAIEAFDRSDYTAAVTSVEKAISDAEQLQNDIETNFLSSFQGAQIAFTNNDSDRAKKAIERALRLKPENTEAAYLYGRIAILPDVLILYQKAEAAGVQNQLLQQYNFLEQILKLDPARQAVATQMQSLGERIKEIRYANLLRETTKLIEADKLVMARSKANSASTIYPNRNDAGKLIQQINAIEKKRRIVNALANAKAFESKDDWPKALAQYNQALGEQSANQAAQNGRERANKIISANNRAVDILNKQTRMQDARIYQRIVDFVDNVKPLTAESAILADTIGILEQTLELWQKDRKVTVLSDGKSIIKVRRVGNVGKTRSKDILLKPGNYEFECSRKGFRSNIVKHFVPPNAEETSIMIVCNVPI
jgi:tetratricopeptide (TPR) repeat protein